MNNIDTKMLAVFDEMYRSKSVSRTADKLNLGQPAVSMALAKFRRHYGDPLFVRTSEGMEPTPLADAIIGPIRQALTSLTLTLQHRASFDAASSTRMFRICMTDIGQRVMMPNLLSHFRATAPSVRIDLSYVSENTPNDLESGQVDLALGFLSGIDAGFFQQGLFSERFVCMISNRHPRLRGESLTLSEFEAESHLVVATQGTGHGVVEQTLHELGITRNIGLRIPNFLGVVSNITDSEYLSIVPYRFGQILVKSNHTKLLELPFEIPAYRVMQHWHSRYALDPGIIWLRKTISELFREG